MGKWIKRIQSYHKDTVRLWQTDSFRTRKKERRTVGIRVLLLILVSEGPQARPLKSSATVLSFTMSYSQFLFPSTSPFSNYVPLSLSLSLHSSLKLPFSLQGQADAVTNQRKKKKPQQNVRCPHIFFPIKSLSLSTVIPLTVIHPSLSILKVGDLHRSNILVAYVTCTQWHRYTSVLHTASVLRTILALKLLNNLKLIWI